MSISAISLAESGLLPDRLIRVGVRRLLRKRILKEKAQPSQRAEHALRDALEQGPITVHAAAANQQHYEVPARFYQYLLGPQLKYSCGYWPRDATSLAESEQAMLELSAKRAQLQNGQRILELGCGWGSLTLWMAAKFPAARIVGVSNSHGQRLYIEAEASRRGLGNVQIVTCDIADFAADGEFDRIVSIEMFEHVRNHRMLMDRIARWLADDGRLFVHLFCHREIPYLFETEGADNWMGQHFFTGGMMPSRNWLPQLSGPLMLESSWDVDGRHYQKTCEAWLDQLDRHRRVATKLLRENRQPREASAQLQRWRIFLMACAELFGFRNGQEWFVSHYRFARR